MSSIISTGAQMVESKPKELNVQKILSKEENSEFNDTFQILLKDLTENPDFRDMPETNRWLAKVLQFNVPHGKRNRGLAVALSYQYLTTELTEENVKLSYILGWAVEMLQAYFLVADDIMDGSETRRGEPCWYKLENVGLSGINDALLLHSSIYELLKKYFREKDYYVTLLEILNEVNHKTIYGQSLDTRTGNEKKMETYTMEKYSAIVKYKTSYYSYYLPVSLAMAMAGIKDANLLKEVKTVTLEMGHIFQVQDDFLDCFGDVKVTGKIGTDIQDCKCSWLFVTAMEKCSQEQKKILLENYGIDTEDKIQAVKNVYKELKLDDIFHKYEDETFELISRHIQQMSPQIPKSLFVEMLSKIYRRQK